MVTRQPLKIQKFGLMVSVFYCFPFLFTGCAIKTHHDLWKLKYFDFSEFIVSSRSEFTGRTWLYQEMDEVLEQTETRGVLLIGNPGSGKTAFVCQLLCSRTSSPIIHDRILGYHFCMHSDKGTQSAAKFVQNLANMAASRIEGYRDILSRDSFVQRVLQQSCTQDPEWCFQEGIITPLNKLKRKPKQPLYVIIDALDECAADKGEILSMLKSKVHRLPIWLKLIITSRYTSSITTSFKGMPSLELRSNDERNLEDIENYVSNKIYPLQGSIISRIKAYFLIRNNDSPTQRIVSTLVKKSQGNFLFVRVVLNVLLTSANGYNWTGNVPKTLDNIFQLYFERKFSTRESFQSLREIFEILVASYTPLSAEVIHSVIKLDNPSALDFEYDFMPKLEQVSLFLGYELENGHVRIYHASLSEWLTSETNKGRLFYINKQKGHKRLAKYYLKITESIEKNVTAEEAFHLACHIVEGGSDEHQKREFLSLPSRLVNCSDELNTTALHMSAQAANEKVTKLLLKHFYDIDCLDNNQRTPAFMAASTGRLKNLIYLFERGANLKHIVTCTDVMFSRNPLTKYLVNECRRRTCQYSLLHIAAQEGNIDVVRFLIKTHMNVLEKTGCNSTAVHLAANNGHLEVLEALRKAGGVLDGVSLHDAAAGGHKRVVDYLLNEGVNDDCITDIALDSMKANTENTNWSDIRVHMGDSYHLKMGETALHAAVKGGHLSVIKLLLNQRESAIKCLNAAGRSPLHEAVYLNSFEVLEVMLATGIDTSVKCNTSVLISPYSNAQLLLPELRHNYCACGFTPLHIAAMHGYHRVAELLVRKNADVNAGDCSGSTPLHIASCHGMEALLTLLVKNGAKINRRSYNSSTPLHSAATCLATSSFCTLLDLGSNFSAKDNKNMTALHYFLRNIKIVGKEYFADLYVEKPINWIKALNKKQPWEKSGLQFSWLNKLIRITYCLSSNVVAKKSKIWSGTALNKKQPWEKSGLQFSWINKLIRIIYSLSNNVVAKKSKIWSGTIINAYDSAFYLLEEKANASFQLTGIDGLDDRYLVAVATPSVFLYDIILQTFVKKIDQPFLPGAFKKALIRIAGLLVKLNCSLLTRFIKGNLVRTTDALLQAGWDVNCQDHSGLSPVLVYLYQGGPHMSKVLTKHNVQIDILCGEPFKISLLHMISYHKLHYLHYLSEYARGEKNWSKYLESEDSLFDYFFVSYEEVHGKNESSTVVGTGDGPLALAIKSHPQGLEVVNECFDADGYNAFHRAAQGANVIAIERFLDWGANPNLKNADGFSPLWLSVLYSVKYSSLHNLQRENMLRGLELHLASTSATIILNHLLQDGTVNIGCNESHSDLTLYHIAATRGMWLFIHHLLLNKQVTGLDVNCPNKHGITPMYLAKLACGENCNLESPSCKVVEVIKNFGGKLRYPTIEAEYSLFFHFFLEMSPGHMFLELEEHEILTLHEECECCESEKNHLLKASSILDKVYHNCTEIIKQCDPSTYTKGCLPAIHQDLPHFHSVMGVFHQHQRLRSKHSIIRYSLVTFLNDGYNDIQRRSLGCKPIDRTSYESQQQTTTGTYTYREERRTTAPDERDLRTYYLHFKESFDKLQTYSLHAKDVSFTNGSPPRFLLKLDSALNDYWSTLLCDWQAVSYKYVMLNFQLWNLQLLTLFTTKNHRMGVSISDFAARRIRKALFEPSKDSLQLVARLAFGTSYGSFDNFDYLTILKFRKPPFWENIFDPYY